MPTGCLPSVSSNGEGVGGRGAPTLMCTVLYHGQSENRKYPPACRSRRPAPFQVVLGCREVGGASAAAPWCRRRCGETRASQ